MIPVRRGFEVADARRQVLADYALIESHTKARLVRHIDPTVVDDRRLRAFFHK